MKPSSILRMALVVAGAATLSACGASPSSIFKNATFSTYTQNGDQYLQLETDISSSSIVFTGVTIPIQSGGNILGDVGVSTDLKTGTSAMVVQLDLTKILKTPTPTLGGNLPNGLPWPVTGVNLNTMLNFNVGSNGSKAYLYYDPTAKTTMLGAALDVSALNVGVPATLFAPFSTSSGISGLVGLYTGRTANSSGVAFLANVSKFISLATGRLTVRRLAARKSTTKAVQFFATSPKSKVRRKIDAVLYRLNETHAHITLH